MGRIKDLYFEEQRIKEERADAAYSAVPEALHDNLTLSRELLESHQDLLKENAKLHIQLSQLQSEFKAQTGTRTRWMAHGIGFASGVAASVVASFVWLQLAKQWPLFR